MHPLYKRPADDDDDDGKMFRYEDEAYEEDEMDE